MIVKSNVLYVIFQTCWACLHCARAGSKGHRRLRVWGGDFLSFFRREGKTVLRQVNFIIPSCYHFIFFTKTKRMFVFVDVESQRHRRASFFWDWCKLFLENKFSVVSCLFTSHFDATTVWLHVHILCKPLMSVFFHCRTQTNFGVVWFGESSFLVFLS